MNISTQKILDIFSEICKIPRTSRNEEQMSNWIIQWGKDHGFETIKDTYGNVVVKIPATKGLEDKDGYVLQAHMDMVGQKTKESTHDFLKDPIQTKIEGDWLKSVNGTTLGADDGIAIAIMMALAESDMPHPKLELVFTREEEIGIEGAMNLPNDILECNKLINLDSEEDGEIAIGCAGSQDITIRKQYPLVDIPKDSIGYQLNISGGQGGHSGIDIDKKRASSNVLMSRLLYMITEKIEVNLLEMKGGSVRNGISTETNVVISIKKDDVDILNDISNSFVETVIKGEYSDVEKGLKLSISETKDSYTKGVDLKDTKEIIHTMNAIPHGVLAMSYEMPGLVESSNNFALISLSDGLFELICMCRSSVRSRIKETNGRLRCIAGLIGVDVEDKEPSSSWKPNVNSQFLKDVSEKYKRLFGKEPKIYSIHAGLECGTIGEKYPDMDMISIGCTVIGAHTPEERLQISTIDNLTKWLGEILG